MQENSKRHIDTYSDFESFYKRLIDKADRIHHALCLIHKHTTFKNTQERFEYLRVDFLEMSYMLHPIYNEDHVPLKNQIELILREVKTLTQGIVIQGVLKSESKALFDKEIDLFIEALHLYGERLESAKLYEEGGIISPLFQDNFFGEEIDMTLLPKQLEKKSFAQFGEQTNLLKMSDTKKEDIVPKGHQLEAVSNQGPAVMKKKTDVVERINRKTAILNFIKENKETRIKDILFFVKDCSEKTIQRELNDLIKDGVIKKEGERRWSRYSLLKEAKGQ